MSRITAIVDYGSGNLRSAEKAFQRAASEAGHQGTIIVTADADLLSKADHIVLPGVGAFADCRSGLDQVDGMIDALEHAVLTRGQPFLGICVGMQLMATRGLEKRMTQGLNWIEGDVKLMALDDDKLRIPQIGWNTLDVCAPHSLLDGIPVGPEGWHAYFVHSYYFAAAHKDHVVATTSYGGAMTAMVASGNMVGTQFHPEKSQKLGLKLISNFLKWTP